MQDKQIIHIHTLASRSTTRGPRFRQNWRPKRFKRAKFLPRNFWKSAHADPEPDYEKRVTTPYMYKLQHHS